jgi:PIN domain nuclease of toxin-antitoxin system
MILLDTHVWVRWLDPEVKPLPQSLLDHLATEDKLAVSAVTCWEVSRKLRNQLVHEYMTSSELFLEALLAANEVSSLLIETVFACGSSCRKS